ncbi:AMP-binding protein [Pseudomonas syringae pv. aptata]|uniref:AMP-binding protein n=1 Tax=Pseudomonas syringae TaxID=317 RepID=UPI003F88B954
MVDETASLTYSELNARANRLAHYLIGLGIQPDDRVAICAQRSLEMVVGLLGIFKAGGAYVPLDPAYPAAAVALHAGGQHAGGGAGAGRDPGVAGRVGGADARSARCRVGG